MQRQGAGQEQRRGNAIPEAWRLVAGCAKWSAAGPIAAVQVTDGRSGRLLPSPRQIRVACLGAARSGRVPVLVDKSTKDVDSVDPANLGQAGPCVEALGRHVADGADHMAPDDIDEALFYYCNRMIKSWKIAWELRDLSEPQARAYLASFFQSEIPRLFWHQHGQWHMQAKLTNRRARFVVMINEEYLRAIHSRPPTRNREFCQPSRRSAKPSRRHLVDADNINERPTVP
jgi:hypothetical protein